MASERPPSRGDRRCSVRVAAATGAIDSLRTDRRFLTVLFLLVALTVAVRIPLLHESLWLDEVASARVATQPTLPKMLSQIRRTESTPPAWYAVAWATRQVIGPSSDDVAYLRWLSILFSAAATALTFVYASRILPRPGAALAGAVTALGPTFVEHGPHRPWRRLTFPGYERCDPSREPDEVLWH